MTPLCVIMRTTRCLGLHLRVKHFCVRWQDDNEDDARAADADDAMAGTDAALQSGSFVPRAKKGLHIQTYGIPGAVPINKDDAEESTII